MEAGSRAPMAGPAAWRWRRVLQRSPFHGQPCPAELASLPDLLPHEYAQVAALAEAAPPAPVLVSWSQHYRLLAETVRALRAQLPGALLLVAHHAPNHVVPLPAELLAADVLLTHDPVALARSMAGRAHGPVVAIDDDLRRDSHEPGVNAVSVTVFGVPDPAPLEAALRASPLAAAACDGFDATPWKALS